MKQGAYRDASEHLADYLARIAWLLEDRDSLEPLFELDAAIAEREDATTAVLPLLALRGWCGLDLASVHLLVAAAVPMLDLEVAGTIRERIAGMTPTVEELVALLACSPEDEAMLRAALSPEAPLGALGLVTIAGSDVPAHMCNVVVDARVAAFLRGEDTFDAALRGLAELHRELVLPVPAAGEGIVEHVLTIGGGKPIVIEGGAGIGKATAAIAAATRIGKRAIVVDVDAIAAAPASEACALLARARREALLHHAVLVVRLRTWTDALPAALRRELVALVQAGDAIAATRDADALCRQLRGARRIRLALPGAAEQVALWRSALEVDLDVTALVAQYPLPAGDILAAGASARAAAELERRSVTATDALVAARGRIAHRLGEVAQVVTTTLTWDDLVLRPEVAARVSEIVGAVRHRDRVMTAWGFSDKVPYGRSTTALFSGAPGTGKTMVATLIGKELGLEVFRVDLSKVVSKYIGETEANLDRVFGEASRCRAILLFDEADALFAKRTEVKSSNDRYANLEVNFLLQRLEAHDGIVILTTNAATSIDPAFLRRLRYRIEFAKPDEDERAALWRAMIPPAAPLASDVDFAILARHFRMCGGDIKNAVVRAAYLAAGEGRAALDHDVLVRGAALEWSELGNLPVALELLALPAPRPEVERLSITCRDAAGETVVQVAPDPEPTVVVDIDDDRDPGATLDGVPEPELARGSSPALIVDGGAVREAVGARLDAGVEATLMMILCDPPRFGETIAAHFGRREAELAVVFATLSPPASRVLHRRLAQPITGDAMAAGFARMTAERRGRLLGFLADAPRRAVDRMHLRAIEHGNTDELAEAN